jgi:SAM-dependent methyltransferase
VNAHRSRTQGLRRIIQFNRPKLVVASAAVGLSASIAMTTDGAVSVLALLTAVASAYFLVASLAVSWWVYDRSALQEWRWITGLVPVGQTRWVLLHVGFDATGPTLSATLGGPDAVIDVSPQLRRLSPSLRRARRHDPTPATEFAKGARLPLATSTLDTVLLVFAAHEVRDASAREALFAELHRVLRPTGRVIVVEHVRDAANIAAFGPGAWHFQPRREWLRLAHRSGLDTIEERKLTAFVRALAMSRS